ncbi:adenosylcobinamide-GDP ribazoletransferase [soil metagenome]
MKALTVLTKFIHTASYVTIIPLARLLPASAVNEDSLKGLALYLPSVGLMIGFMLAVTCLALEALHTANFLLATLITILWLTITGGLHFDGLMDTADGILSHRSKERMLEIMQDSRVGNFAVMVGVAAFALKVAALTALSTSLSATLLAYFLLFAPCFGRLAETFAIGAFSYARPEGKGKVWHDTMKFPQDLFLAMILPLALFIGAVVLSNGSMLIPLAIYFGIACGAGLISAVYLNNRLGGQTGDTYGAVVELTETISLTVFALIHI